MSARHIFILAGLLLLAPIDADAGCAQIWEQQYISPEYEASAEVSVEFTTNGNGGRYDCSYYEEVGAAGYAWASYGAAAGIYPPNGHSGYSVYVRSDWGASAAAFMSVAGTGPGDATALSGVFEYLVDAEGGYYFEDHGSWSYSRWVEGSTNYQIELTATNYAPLQNSGNVTVAAHLSHPGMSNAISWGGCSPDSSNVLLCYVDTSTVGIRSVAVFFDGVEMRRIEINVQPAGGQQPSASLRLLLDGDGIDPANAYATDDWSRFVPGTSFSTGSSVQLPQQVTLVAAYVTDQGQIVSPPQGVTSITFGLQATTSWVGYATNANRADERDLQYDYGLGNSTDRLQTLDVAISGNQARVSLWVHDYGALTKIQARVGEFGSDLLNLPSSHPGDGDADESPGSSHVGDGLSEFEEWRGFIIQGFHIRTSPYRKDLFVYHTDPDLAAHGYGYASNLVINIYVVLSNEQDGNSWINANSLDFLGSSGYGEVPGHRGQRALHIAEAGFALGYDGLWVGQWNQAPFGVNNTLRLEIYSRTIRQISPTHNSQTTPDPAYDGPKTAQTIAHEIGHAVKLNHIDVDNLCPAPTFTVMLGQYFRQYDATDQTTMCAWNAIPSEYTSSEILNFDLR